MRSLAFKLALAFLVVSVTVVALVAAFARHATITEFDRYVLEQAQSDFVTSAAAYYASHDSWAGVDAYFGQRTEPPPPPQPQNNPDAQPPRPAFSGGPALPSADGPGGLPLLPGAPGRPPPPRRYFTLVDQSGGVVLPAGPYHVGDQVPEADLRGGAPVQVDGKVVATVLTISASPDRDPIEQRYLGRTNQALLNAALIAAALALVLGILLARTLTRPLHELTNAIRSMATGDLEQQVQVRSKDELGELAAAFNQMSADLIRADRLRRQMTADIAHDLRTPLTVISGYIESMRDGVLKPSPARFDAMNTEAQHLLRLVEDLRTLSLADAGELALHCEFVAPQALLERQADAYRHLAEQQNIDLLVRPGTDLPDIHVDPERMAQVLGNLVSNALRYTPAGGTVALSAQRQDDVVLLTVQDTGTGIASEALPHVFDRFYRADESRHQQGGESGLGLAIAKSLVELQQGRITVDSEVGQGTTFRIALPVT